jgi:hypothetical protein
MVGEFLAGGLADASGIFAIRNRHFREHFHHPDHHCDNPEEHGRDEMDGARRGRQIGDVAGCLILAVAGASLSADMLFNRALT